MHVTVSCDLALVHYCNGGTHAGQSRVSRRRAAAAASLPLVVPLLV